jgi:glutamine amidotransferase
VFLDVVAANISPIAGLVRHYPIKSKHIVAHIRKATRGAVALANCHPFQRELWGRYWVFAHNGTLESFNAPRGNYYQAVGETDSEAAFCYMLESLRNRFASGEPAATEVYACLSETTEELRKHGPFNFLLSDGQHLYAHRSTQLHYVVRQAPFAAAHLTDRDVTVDFSELTTSTDRVAVIATVPLTDNECWLELPLHELTVFREGAVLNGG